MIEIEPLGPYSWEAACDVLGHFAPMTQHWRGTAEVVPMAFPLDGDFTPVAVALRWEHGALRGEVAGTEDEDRVRRQVARILSLDHDGRDYPKVSERDPQVGRLMAALPGLRPVNFTSPYETAAWAVISQRISMHQAAGVKARLLEARGHPLRVGGHDVTCFPRPERLLQVSSIPGLAEQKVERLHGVARAALAGLLDADRLIALGPVAGPESVQVIPGIGPFWSSGIYLRGCGIADEFPDNEPVSVAALGRLHGLGDRPSAEQMRELTDRFRPFRMWVCFLLRVGVGRGLIEGVAGREMALRRAASGGSRGARTSRFRPPSAPRTSRASAPGSSAG